MQVKLLNLKEKAEEMGISYRWAKELKKRKKLPAVWFNKMQKGDMKNSRQYYLPKLNTMELLEFCYDHKHIGKPCVCKVFIDEIKARQTKESTIL